MVVLTAESLPSYLRNRLNLGAREAIESRELHGGVSNAVFLVTLANTGERFVLKQARERLRVQEEWLCSVERIWREVETLRICGEVLAARSGERGAGKAGEAVYEAAVPPVLWEDRENYCYAMTAAPEGHRTWKKMLLAKEAAESAAIAAACGKLLGALHAGSWNNESIAKQLDDRTYFDQLRLDPYYRHVARVHPDLAPQLGALIKSIWQNRRCLVHGDFSPKNLLVWPGNVLLIDFEVGHYGDPAFDLGFFLTHVFLKSLWAGPRSGEYLKLAETFWKAYRDVLSSSNTTAGTKLGPGISPGVSWLPADQLGIESGDLEQRAILNLAGCLLARVDGKSPVDYLSHEQQQFVRSIARTWIAAPPPEFAAVTRAWVESLPS